VFFKIPISSIFVMVVILNGMLAYHFAAKKTKINSFSKPLLKYTLGQQRVILA